MNRSGALFLLAGIALIAGRAGATPPPPPGGTYTYYNTAPGALTASGNLIDHSSQSIGVAQTVDGPFQNVGTLETQVFRESSGTLDFLYHITPATTGLMLHSLDVPWIDNEVTLEDAGFASTGLSPVSISRFYDTSPVSFLFNFSLTPGDSNLDDGTANLILHTNADAYTWSDAFTARTIDNGNFEFTDGLGGFIPEQTPEPATLGITALGALLLLQRRKHGI